MKLQKKPSCETGTSIYHAVEVLKNGALSMIEYPYHDSDCDTAPTPDVTTTSGSTDGLAQHGTITVGAYSVVIYSQ